MELSDVECRSPAELASAFTRFARSGPLANRVLNLPDYDPIRSDPRFADLQKKIGLVR